MGKQETKSKMTDLTKSIITLNVDGLNTPIKSQILSYWTKKQDLTLGCL